MFQRPTPRPGTIKTFLILGIIAIFAFSLFSPIAAARSDSHGAPSSPGPFPLQSSVLSWTLVADKPTGDGTIRGGHIIIIVGATAADIASIPKNVIVKSWVTFGPNGKVIYRNDCPLHFAPGSLTATCTIKANFKGAGEYTFYANYLSDGKLVAQQIVDPKIEPEF
jgi:hypothetical protein